MSVYLKDVKHSIRKRIYRLKKEVKFTNQGEKF